MIIDTIENIGKYAKDFPHFAAVKSVVESGALETCATGSYDTEDSAVRYSVSAYQTRRKGTSGYETHEKYADVQIVLDGSETIDVASAASVTPRGEYNGENDIQFFDGDLCVRCNAAPGMFIALFPGEPHEPGLFEAAPSQVRKVVFKIKC